MDEAGEFTIAPSIGEVPGDPTLTSTPEQDARPSPPTTTTLSPIPHLHPPLPAGQLP
jgi:hypothetical protein